VNFIAPILKLDSGVPLEPAPASSILSSASLEADPIVDGLIDPGSGTFRKLAGVPNEL
jgi:hypothetical protein